MYYWAFISVSLSKWGFNNIQLNSILYQIIIKKTILIYYITIKKPFYLLLY